jgi:DNA-binding PadR family transcriptional regulator
MAVKHLVLGVLASGPASGYRVGRRVAALGGLARRVESSRVYATLAAVERAREVAVQTTRDADGRSRRLFHLTDRGRRELDRWIERPVAASEWLRQPLLAKVAVAELAGGGSPPVLPADLEIRRHALRRMASLDVPQAGVARFTHERVRRQLEIEVALLESLLASLTSGGSEAAERLSSRPMRPSALSASR